MNFELVCHSVTKKTKLIMPPCVLGETSIITCPSFRGNYDETCLSNETGFERGNQERRIEAKLDSVPLMFRFSRATHGMTLTVFYVTGNNFRPHWP